MNLHKSPRSLSGFTILELLVVVAIIAILAAIGVPALMGVVPEAELRYSASDTSDAMQQARLKAASSQKPVRAVIDCRVPEGEAATPCTVRLDTARFDANGTFGTWENASGNAVEMDQRVEIATAAGVNRVLADTPDNVFFAVFFPSSQVKASHEPFNLIFSSNRVTDITWVLSVNTRTGRVDLSEGPAPPEETP